MTMDFLPGLAPTSATTPVGGQLCVRKLSQGAAMAGVVHFGPDVSIDPERGYLLLVTPQGLRLAPLPVTEPLPDHLACSTLNCVLKSPVWPKTNRPEAWVVRFVEALPQSNAWVVYGPSHFSQPSGVPDHQWFEIQPDGATLDIKPPFQAMGMTMDQLLKRPVWPAPDGQRYSFPTLQPEWRAHMLRFHDLLAAVGGGRAALEDTMKSIRQDPHLTQLMSSRPDLDYCRFLEELRKVGALGVEQPMTTQQFQDREAVAEACLANVLLNETHQGESRPRAPGLR